MSTGERRQKISKSCDVCRAKKLKCDSGEVCSYCRKHNRKCVYSSVNKPGLKPGYGKEVLRRLSILEDQFRMTDNRLKSIEQQITRDVVPQIQQGLPPVETIEAPLPPPVNIDPIDSADPPFYPGLPPVSVVTNLVTTFFDKVFPIFPIIHPATIQSEIDKYIKHILADPGCGEEPPIVSLGLILNALPYMPQLDMTARQRVVKTCENKIVLDCYAVQSLCQLQALTLLAFRRLSIGNDTESWAVTGMAASGVIYLNLSELPYCRAMNRTKRARILGDPNDWLDKEARRRLLCGVAILDVLSAFASGTPLRIPDSESEFTTPLVSENWCKGVKPSETDAGPEKDAFGYYMQIIRIFRRLHPFLQTPRDISKKADVGDWFVSFHQIETEIREWREALPLKYAMLLNSHLLDFQGAGSDLYSLVLLHAAYNIALIKMHSAYGYPHAESFAFKHSVESRRTCVFCVDGILTLARKISEYERSNNVKVFEFLGPHYGFYLWVCARLLIADAIFKEKEKTSYDKPSFDNKLKQICSILLEIGKHSSGCFKYHKILRKLISLDISNSPIDQDANAEEDDDHMEPSEAIADMRINTHLLSLILTKKLAQLEPLSAAQSSTDLRQLLSSYNYNQQDNSLLEGFHFDAGSFGFEDLFGYLDNNISP